MQYNTSLDGFQLTPERLRVRGRSEEEGGELKSSLRLAVLPGVGPWDSTPVDCMVMSSSIAASKASRCSNTCLEGGLFSVVFLK